jgi:hypothetical protein
MKLMYFVVTAVRNSNLMFFLAWIVYENDTQNLVRRYENNKPLGVNRQRY